MCRVESVVTRVLWLVLVASTIGQTTSYVVKDIRYTLRQSFRFMKQDIARAWIVAKES